MHHSRKDQWNDADSEYKVISDYCWCTTRDQNRTSGNKRQQRDYDLYRKHCRRFNYG